LNLANTLTHSKAPFGNTLARWKPSVDISTLEAFQYQNTKWTGDVYIVANWMFQNGLLNRYCRE